MLHKQDYILTVNKISVLSTLAKELSVAAGIMQSSSK